MLGAVDTSKAVLAAVLPVYLLILAGALVRKIGVLKREQDDAAFRLVFNVLYPCLIIDKILGGGDSVREPSSVLWGIGTGFCLTVLCFGGAWLAAGLLGFQKGTGKRTFTLVAGVQNFGYTAIPVVQQIWGMSAMAMLFVHNLGVELAIWSAGVMILSGDKKIPWRKLVNGPVVAVLLGLSLVGMHADHFLAEASPGDVFSLGVSLRTTISWLGVGAFPVAILITGALMMDLVVAERPSLRVILGGCIVRLAVLPMVLLAAARYLPAPLVLKQVLVVQAAMPSAMTPIMLAKIYGGRPAVAVQVVIATTVASLFTLPFVIVWGSRWAGLS